MATWVNLMDIIYPVGSIYLNKNSQSPASLIGGSWAQVKGACLAGTGSNGFAGSGQFGGSFKISIDQMPSHSHQWKGYNWLQAATSGDKALIVGTEVVGSTTAVGGGKTSCQPIIPFIFGSELLRNTVGGVA